MFFINEPFSTSDHDSINCVINGVLSDDYDVGCDEIIVYNIPDVNDNISCKSAAQHFLSKSYDWHKAN